MNKQKREAHGRPGAMNFFFWLSILQVKALATAIVKLSEKHGLDVSQFGGGHCKSAQPGHLLQVGQQ